jgi:hypothetical protein
VVHDTFTNKPTNCMYLNTITVCGPDQAGNAMSLLPFVLAVRTLLLAIAMVILGATMSQAQETCRLKGYASSWMETGTPFQVQCTSALYTGTLVTVPARRFFRRGHAVRRP